MFRVFAYLYVLTLPYPVLELIPFHGRGLEVVLALVSALSVDVEGACIGSVSYFTPTAASCAHKSALCTDTTEQNMP
jgi:hypothetical protein